MERYSADYLRVPITESERVEARNSESSDGLLHENGGRHSRSQTHSSGSDIIRFPSLQTPGSRADRIGRSITNRSVTQRYSPISPINQDEATGLGRFHSTPKHETVQWVEKFGHPAEPIPDFWCPIWLRRSSLLLLALFFLVLLSAVIILYVFSQKRNGFHGSGTNGYPGWIYVPTIIAVLAYGLWKQVDYHTKSLTPWHVLQQGPASPQTSLLLDYITPLQFVSLFKAIKLNHVNVLATIISSIILQIIIIFSTALFVRTPTVVAYNNLQLIEDSQFDTSSFHPNEPINTSMISSSPVYSYYGSLDQGLPFRPGVSSDLAYITFSTTSASQQLLSADSTVAAEVDAFFPYLTCSQVQATVNRSGEQAEIRSTNVSTGTVSLSFIEDDICADWPSIDVTLPSFQANNDTEHRTVGSLQTLYCARSPNGAADTSVAPAGLLYTLISFSYQQELTVNGPDFGDGSSRMTETRSRVVQNVTNIFCKPSYAIERVKVSNDTSRARNDPDAIGIVMSAQQQNRTFDNISNWNLTNLFNAAISAGSGIFGSPSGQTDEAAASTMLFTLMAKYYQSQDLSTFLNVERLSDAAEATFKGIMAQIINQYFTKNGSNAITGTATVLQHRYKVNDVSAFLMVAGFGIVTVTSILLVFMAPRRVTPQDPMSIAFMATTLSRSMGLNGLLQNPGTPSDVNHKVALTGHEFGTAIVSPVAGQAAFKIVVSEESAEATRQRHGTSTELKWWQPITANLLVTLIIAAKPVALVVVLEIVQHFSDRDHGILTTAENRATYLYAHYIPALVMVIMASLVDVVRFNAALFTPWIKLSKQNASARAGLSNRLVGRTPPMAFLEALRLRSVPAALSTLAALIASALVVAAVGLLSVQNRLSSGSKLSTARLDYFDLQWPGSLYSDNGAAGMTNLILHGNASYPHFTYGELVFPRLSVNTGSSGHPESTLAGMDAATLPALRANLRCDRVQASLINVTTVRANETTNGIGQALVFVQANLPQSCQLGGIFGNDSSFGYALNFPLNPDRQTTYGAQQIDLVFGNYSAIFGNGGERNGELIADNPPVGCPSLAFTLGEFEPGINNADRVTALICYQEIQQVNANVSFIGTSTTIDPSNPPRVDEGSVVLQKNSMSDSDITSFDFRIERDIARRMTPFASEATEDNEFDPFFQAVFYNNGNSLTPESLSGESKAGSLIEAIRSFYRIYMAQAINANMRRPLTSNTTSTSPSRLTARQLTNPSFSRDINDLRSVISTPRLIQHKGNKIALQVMLGVIALLTLMSGLTSRTRHVLPCNPASIAGTMSLLAGSNLCHNLSRDICECCDKHRRSSQNHDHERLYRNDDHDAMASGALHLPLSSHPTNTTESNLHAQYSITSELIHPMGERHDSGSCTVGRKVQMIPEGIEWLPSKEFVKSFDKLRFSMGWWQERPLEGRARRFGVDIGPRANGEDDEEWELGRRRPGDLGFAGFMGVRGGGRAGMDHRSSGGGRNDGRGVYEPPPIMGAAAVHRQGHMRRTSSPDSRYQDPNRYVRGRGNSLSRMPAEDV